MKLPFGHGLWILVLAFFVCGTTGATSYPLKISSANPHILVDQNDVPFLIHGDCAWALTATPNQAEVEQYLENRRQKGFNTVVAMLIARHSSINGGDTDNRYGVQPFTPLNDFSSPNEAYFTNVDWIIDRAAEKGIQLLLAPCYVGYDPEQGWQDVMVANGTNNCRLYGRFLGQHYRGKPNLLWLHSGDNGDPAYFPYIREIALGIREFDTNHLQTAKLWPEQSARDLLGNESWLSLNTTYAYGFDDTFPMKVYDKTLQDYNLTPAMPSFLVESRFEDEYGAGAYFVRRQAYWSVLSGSTGQVMGNGYIWPFASAPFDNSPWQTAMNKAASVGMSWLKRLFDSRPWYTMVPDQSHTVVTAGYGTFDTDNYLTVMRDTTGRTVISYVPTQRTFTVKMTKVSGTQARAWWFNPRDGGVTNFATYATSGNQSFTPPDAADWVLILDDASQPFGMPGSGTGSAPTISDIPDQFTIANTPTAAIPFTVADADAPVTNLVITAASSNPALIPTNNIVFGGSGSNRTVTVIPTLNKTGTATITVNVSDWVYSAAETFTVTVQPSGVLLAAPPQTAGQISASGFRFHVSASVPTALAIECTTNFTSWQQIRTIEYTDTPVEVIDLQSSESAARFYRARVQ